MFMFWPQSDIRTVNRKWEGNPGVLPGNVDVSKRGSDLGCGLVCQLKHNKHHILEFHISHSAKNQCDHIVKEALRHWCWGPD